ncbi:MAG: hypothetical protein KBD83_02460 [Gammaproteobacteria bacterium]|nr:hypothetical protein [Gammaproteobacteria bacterium]
MLPENLEEIIADINQLNPNLLFASKRSRDNYSTQRHPRYIEEVAVQNVLGKSVLSIFGGADTSPLASPDVENLYIIDANPFLSRESIQHQMIETCPDYNNLFHEHLGAFCLRYFTELYASIPYCHSDHDHPINGLFTFLKMRWEEPLTDTTIADEAGFSLQDSLLNSVIQNIDNVFLNLWNYEQISDRPKYDLRDIGLSTIILYRLRFCLEATIENIEQCGDDDIYCISIEKKDGRKAKVYYASCFLGEDLALRERFTSLIASNGGITSVLSRGYPSANVGTDVKGDKSALAREIQCLVQGSVMSGSPAPPLVFLHPYREDGVPEVLGGESEVGSRKTSKTRTEYDVSEYMTVVRQMFGTVVEETIAIPATPASTRGAATPESTRGSVATGLVDTRSSCFFTPLSRLHSTGNALNDLPNRNKIFQAYDPKKHGEIPGCLFVGRSFSYQPDEVLDHLGIKFFTRDKKGLDNIVYVLSRRPEQTVAESHEETKSHLKR